MAQAMTKTRHPLEPLSVDELAEAVAILRAGVPGGVLGRPPLPVRRGRPA